MLDKLFLKLTWPSWTLLGIVILVGGLSFVYYFRSLPPLSPARKRLLIGLRAGTLFLIILLLLEPRLHFVFTQKQLPTVAVLIDNSSSMQVKDPAGPRTRRLFQSVRRLQNQWKGDSLNVRFFTFGKKLQPWTDDSLRFDEHATNFSLALRQVVDSLMGHNLKAVVIFSDGIVTEGPDPVRLATHMPVPIFTVLVGDSSLPKDVILRSVRSNRISYRGKALPVEVLLWHNGFENKRVRVSILRGEKVVYETTARLGRSGLEQKLRLSFVPQEVGDWQYRIRLHPLPGELTDRNNETVFKVTVLKDKYHVLVFSGRPDFDRRFLKYVSDFFTEFRFHFYTEKRGGRFYEGELKQSRLDSVDLILLHGFPTDQTPKGTIQRIWVSIRQRNPSVLWLVNRNFSPSRLAEFQETLPFFLKGTSLSSLKGTSVQRTAQGRRHPLLQLDEDPVKNRQLWDKLPPLEVYSGFRLPKAARILLTASLGARENGLPKEGIPLLWVWREQGRKQVVLSSANWGFWHFQLQEDPLKERFFSRFLEKMLKWLVSREDLNPVQVLPLKAVLNLGDALEFSGRIFDELFQPVADASVFLEISGENYYLKDALMAVGQGYYRLILPSLPVGEYRYTITALRNDQSLGVRTGKVVVHPFNREFQQTVANGHLMRQLAAVSGGKFYLPEMVPDKPDFIDLAPQTRFAAVEKYLWEQWIWLPMIVFLLALEWFLRKRWGML